MRRRRRRPRSAHARPCRYTPRSACPAPARRSVSPPSLAPEAREHLDQLVDLLLALALRARAKRVGHAGLDMPTQQELLDLLERALHRGDLEQDVDAVGLGVDHPLEPLHLPLDSPQPSQRLGLRLLVDHAYTPWG